MLVITKDSGGKILKKWNTAPLSKYRSLDDIVRETLPHLDYDLCRGGFVFVLTKQEEERLKKSLHPIVGDMPSEHDLRDLLVHFIYPLLKPIIGNRRELVLPHYSTHKRARTVYGRARIKMAAVNRDEGQKFLQEQ